MRFNVTFETITEESAENGDTEDSGFLSQDIPLRDALDEISGDGCHVEADSCSPAIPRWFTFYHTNDGTREFYETGTHENRALHLPDDITPSSALRIARLVGAYTYS